MRDKPVYNSLALLRRARDYEKPGLLRYNYKNISLAQKRGFIIVCRMAGQGVSDVCVILKYFAFILISFRKCSLD